MPAVNLYNDSFFFSGRFKNTVKKFLGRPSRGPQIVEANLIAGLEKIGVSVNLNAPFAQSDKRLCILSGFKTLIRAMALSKVKVVVGPNFSAKEMVRIYNKYSRLISCILAPSQEVKFTFIHYGIPEAKINIWPVGIDTDGFKDASQIAKTCDALIYFKRRTAKELRQVIELLENKGQTYLIIEYGHYSKADFKDALAKCRYAVVLDGTESQGIALEEIMSSNLPMFVFDQIYLGESLDASLKESLRATSTPYWSNVCGVRVPTDMCGESKNPYLSIPDSAGEFEGFLSALKSFQPRGFVLNNLTLQKQAWKFMEVFGI